MMDHFFYISVAYQGETPESEYQVKIPKTREELEGKPIKYWFDINPLIEDQYQSMLQYTTPSHVYGYLDFHYDKFINLATREHQGLDFLFFIMENLNISDKHKTIDKAGKIKNSENPITESRKTLILEWVAEKRKELKEAPNVTLETRDKIKWNGSPEILGFLFLELVRKGYIDPPLYHGKPNFTGFSKLVWQSFDINSTPGNLERALNESNNQLSDYKRDRLKLPLLSEIA